MCVEIGRYEGQKTNELYLEAPNQRVKEKVSHCNGVVAGGSNTLCAIVDQSLEHGPQHSAAALGRAAGGGVCFFLLYWLMVYDVP